MQPVSVIGSLDLNHTVTGKLVKELSSDEWNAAKPRIRSKELLLIIIATDNKFSLTKFPPFQFETIQMQLF